MQIPQKKKIKMELCDRAISFLSIHLKVPKSAYHGDTCRLMFIVAQLTTTKLRSPPRCPSIDEQKKQAHTVRYSMFTLLWTLAWGGDLEWGFVKVTRGY